MKHIFTLILFTLIFGKITHSQTTVCLGDDATVCLGNTVTIQDCNPGGGGGGANIISLSPASASYSLSDDSYTGVVNIGFPFEFYGNTYTQCVIGSNGVITFDLAKANGYCPWALGGVGTLPNNTFGDAMNTMMPAYQDMNPSAFASPVGEIRSETIGTAPNRRFIILFKDIISFGANAGECTYMGIIMNEGSNSFEFHLGNKPLTPGWNGGLAIQGSENITGTVAHITPGRNNTQWVAFQEAKIWTPTSPMNTTNYTISNIPYLTITSPNTTYTWGNTANNTTEPYNNGILLVDPILSGLTGYFLTAQAQGCGPVGGSSDTTWITGVSSAVGATAIDDICSAGIGSVTANPLGGIPGFTYNWPALGSTNTTVNNVSAGTYTVQMIDGNGCMSSANVTVGDIPANYSSSSTLISCPGGNDGTAFAEMIPVIGNLTYLWDDPLAQTTQTAVGLTAGTYNCIITSDVGCSNTLTVTVTEIPGMIGNIVTQSDVTCNSGNNGMIEVNVINGTGPYTYSWDNSSSTTNTANDLVVGNHTVTVTDFNGCIITIDGILNEPPSLSITSLTPDTQICPEDDITLDVTGNGGSSPLTFTWYDGNVQLGTGNQMVVDPDVTNTQYCVILSEACGSPEDTMCNLIYFPTPIIPMAEPDELEKCVPSVFDFINTSTNGGEIATTYWDFGMNDLIAIENGNGPISLEFGTPGVYDLIMTATSIYGCVYTDTIQSIMEVLPSPTANFGFSANPATIFETTIFMQNTSSSDVISWQWFSPYSTPSMSNSVNPTFEFQEGVVAQYPVTLAVETDRGCVDTVTYQFNVVSDILFFAPNTFTPDGDEFNQRWLPSISGIDIYDFDLYIFNKWGELIWESHDPSIGWDGTYKGKQVQQGTYVWRATVADLYSDASKEFNGIINLIR